MSGINYYHFFMKLLILICILYTLFQCFPCFLMPDDAVALSPQDNINHQPQSSNQNYYLLQHDYSTINHLFLEQGEEPEENLSQNNLEELQKNSQNKRPILSDGSEDYIQKQNSDSNELSSHRAHLRSEQEISQIIYVSDIETQYIILDQSPINYIHILIIILVLGKIAFIIWVIFRAFKKRNFIHQEDVFYQSPYVSQFSIQQIENQIRFHQNESQNLKKYFLNSAQSPIIIKSDQQMRGYGNPQLYLSQRSKSHQSQRSSDNYQMKQEFRLRDYQLTVPIQQDPIVKTMQGVYLPLRQRVTIQIINKDRISNKDMNQGQVISIKKCLNVMKSIPRHNNISKIHEVIETKTQIYLVIDPRGQSLSDYIATKGKLSVAQSITILKQIVNAIDDLHNLGISHQNLNLNNIYLTNKGCVKIQPSFYCRLSKPSEIFTTQRKNHYTSPEAIKGRFNPFPADVWSIGVIFYRLLEGDFPFYDCYISQMCRKIIEEDFILHVQINNLCKILLKGMMIKNPIQRFGISQIKNWILLSQRQNKDHTSFDSLIDMSEDQLQNADRKQAKNLNSNQNKQIQMQIFSGDYESHYVFRRDPEDLFQRLCALLERKQIEYNVFSRYSVKTQKGLQISLKILEGLENAFIIVFSQKTPSNALILEQLHL